MTTVSSADAGRLLGGLSSETIRVYADNGILKAKRVGKRGRYKFDIADLRQFAEDNQREFDNNLAMMLEQTDQ